MKQVFIPILAAMLLVCSCENKATEKTDGSDSVNVIIENDTVDEVKKIDSLPPNSKIVDSLLKKPVTTPANNPFGLKAGDNLLSLGALNKEPLKTRLMIILGDKFDDYKKYLTTAKPLKKDSDGFLYTQGAAAKGSKNQAFFLYQHEKDVLFVGFQKEEERIMLNDMKSRLFAPESVDMWAERPIE